MTSPHKLFLCASAAALLLAVLSPLAANADETTYKNHGDCVKNEVKGGEARGTAARSDCGKKGEEPPPPSSDTEVRIGDPDIHRGNTADPLIYRFGGGGWSIVPNVDTSSTTTWTWTFGDGTSSVPVVGLYPGTVQHTYSAPGEYTATLTISESTTGLSDSWSTTWMVDESAPLYAYYPDGTFAGGYDHSEPDGIDRIRRLPFQGDV